MSPQRMTYAEYEGVSGVRWSHLKEMRTSPLHYRVRSQKEREDTPSMALGRAVHSAVFEPELFETEYVVCDLNRNSNDWKAFRAEHDPERILKPAERENALRIAEAVRAYPEAAEILAVGQAEQVVTWTDPGTGIGRKARLDWVTPPDVAVLADLKTAADIGDNMFGRAAGRYCYHGQLVDYAIGLEIETGVHYQPVIIAVENNDVNDVRVADVTGAELSVAENLVRDLLDRLAECIATDSWPGQFTERGKLNLPPWDLFQDDQTTEIEVLSS
jgi:PDDEXK-like domain of unknown function (DUF3799)